VVDDKARMTRLDRQQINIEEEYELRNWSERFGLSQETIREAVIQVGPLVKDVRKALGA
jgi:hypothetical protein